MLTVGSDRATMNGTAFKLDSPPMLKDGYTYVPARFVGEALGIKVEWDAPTDTVI